jgi:hypothetical protein
MPQRFTPPAAGECYRRAAEAGRLAAGTADPAEKRDLLTVEQRWLTLALKAELELETEEGFKKQSGMMKRSINHD